MALMTWQYFFCPSDLCSHRRAFSSLGGLFPALLILGESLVLRLVPGLVEAALDLIVEMACPHSRQSAEPSGRLDIAYEAHNHHRRGFKDGYSLNHFLLV